MPIGGRRRFDPGRRSEGRGAAWRILVVDDDEAVREYLEAVLARAGYDVTGAATGEEAVEQAIQKPPDLVTLDMILPGIDGLEVLRRLGQVLPQVPVIMLSGHAPAGAGDEALRLGARDFLRKPLDPEELERAVTHALEA